MTQTPEQPPATPADRGRDARAGLSAGADTERADADEIERRERDRRERPDETPAERYDRNWTEVLQELRVMQTGTQIITGFLLALAFQPAFADLTNGQTVFYLVLVVLSSLSAIIALAPVALHRILFQHHAKRLVVAYGHAALITALVTVSLLLVGVVAFVFDVVVSDAASWIAGISLGLVILATWVVAPAIFRVRLREGTKS